MAPTPPEPSDTTARPPEDPLAVLRERVRATQEAAERLAAEASALGPADGARDQTGPPGRAAGERAADEAQSLVALVGMLRGLLPDEVYVQLTQIARQLLLLVRALIDVLIDRLEGGRAEEPQVEDVPIA